ncbi:DUF1761 domain-containing protein [Candidatus Daviesbacteria bacterium]|nr:DUF1761 domain-containing protein [Candidatus Daviesbacteria bacterium]
MIQVNIAAVLVSGVASMAIGYIWYSKAVFGNKWIKLIGYGGEKMDNSQMMKTYSIMFLVSLIMAYILAIFIHYAGAYSLVLGAKTGLWAWIGFVVPTTLANQLFSKKPLELYGIEVGHHLVNLLVIGAILGSWY